MTKLAIIAAKINEMAKEKQSLECFCLKITAQLGTKWYKLLILI